MRWRASLTRKMLDLDMTLGIRFCVFSNLVNSFSLQVFLIVSLYIQTYFLKYQPPRKSQCRQRLTERFASRIILRAKTVQLCKIWQFIISTPRLLCLIISRRGKKRSKSDDSFSRAFVGCRRAECLVARSPSCRVGRGQRGAYLRN